MRCFLCVLLVALGAAIPVYAAGPQSVYGPSAPGDSAFVRVLNALSGTAALRVDLGATRFGPVAPNTVSSYEPVVPDVYLLRAGGKELEVIAQSRAWFTVVCTTKGLFLFEDPPHTDPARAQLFLYNLTSAATLDLKTADGKTVVLAGVKPGASAQVVVNALTVSLAVYSGATVVKPVGSLTLQRGSSYSVFVLGEGAATTLLSVKADVKVE